MISQYNVQSEGRRRLQIFLVIFRWLAVGLGLAMTWFGDQKHLINPLNQFLADVPYLLNLLLIVYHAVATFVMLRFDDSRLNVALLIFADAIAGAYMSFYYGMPYFYAAVLLPTLVAAFYFDLLVSMVVVIVSLIFYGSVIAVPMIKILRADANADLKISHIYHIVSTFFFSGLAIFIGFKWAQRQEEDVQYMMKKYTEEKHLLNESHKATKKEFGAIFTELENKQELLGALEDSVEKSHEERKRMQAELDEALKEIEDLESKLRNTISKTTVASNSLEQLNTQLQEKEEEYSEQLDALRGRVEELEQEISEKESYIEQVVSEIRAREEIIEERDKVIEKLQVYVVSTKTESSGRVEDLEQKISMLVSKINQQNSALQARENLYESYSRMNQNIDPETVFPAVVTEAVKLVPSQTSILFCFEESENGPLLYAEAAATPYKNLFVDYSVFPGEGPVGLVAKTQKPFRIDNGELRLKSGEEYSTLLTYEKSALIVPILHEGKMMGVLYLGNPKPNAYTDKDTYLMTSFCKLAGPTIHTAKAFEQAAQLVLTEPDTGLYNEAYFLERFTSEMARSERYKIPITLSLLEIENYQRFAETADKNMQARIIKDLVEILKTNIRETDLAARLEDNRFAILFLHSEKHDTLMVAERIRMSAEMRSFGNQLAKRAGLHLSIGLASYPDDAETRDNLYEVALKCVEDAKRRGGNQTVFSP